MDGPNHEGLARVPKPREPGPEMAALSRFLFDTEWSGRIEAGGMGPGTPAMTAEGGGTVRPIQGGRWLAGDYWQDQRLADGTFVLRWELLWVVGWDADAAIYRATYADCYGHAGMMDGQLDGDTLVFDSLPAEEPHLRMTWRLQEDGLVVWRNEASIGGRPFALIEEYRCRRSGADARDRP